MRITGGERAFLLLSGQDEELTIDAARNRAGEDLPLEDFAGSKTVLKKVKESERSLYIPRLEETDEYADAESIRSLKLKTAICFPLFQQGLNQKSRAQLSGVLYLDSASEAHPLKEEHLQLMKVLANHVAICFQNARLFEELQEKNRQIASLNEQLQRHVEVQADTLLEMRIVLEEQSKETGQTYGLGNIVGRSAQIQKVFKIVQRVAPTEATVLISGESGTGKELIAKYLHQYGPRAKKPMISVNCGAFY